MSIGEKISERRKELGFTQEELAEKMGYKSKSTINKIELGKNDIPQSKIAKFADVLQTTTGYLMGWEDEPKHNQILTAKDERDIARRLEETLSELEAGQDGLMFSGEPLDYETRELLKISLENSIRLAKVTAKEKFTPKKYKK